MGDDNAGSSNLGWSNSGSNNIGSYNAGSNVVCYNQVRRSAASQAAVPRLGCRTCLPCFLGCRRRWFSQAAAALSAFVRCCLS